MRHPGHGHEGSELERSSRVRVEELRVIPANVTWNDRGWGGGRVWESVTQVLFLGNMEM